MTRGEGGGRGATGTLDGGLEVSNTNGFHRISLKATNGLTDSYFYKKTAYNMHNYMPLIRTLFCPVLIKTIVHVLISCVCVPRYSRPVWFGIQGYAEITIRPSDVSNGLIGFAENSKNVEADEDLSPIVTLTLIRLNAYYGDVRVFWRAKLSRASSEREDVQLNGQLRAVSGMTTCPPDISVCGLEVELIDDSVSLRWRL